MITSISPIPKRRPSAMRKTGVLGPDGREVSWFLYPSPRGNLRGYKPRQWLSNDTKTNVSPYDRQELVNYARQLRAQIDLLDGAVTQKNSWAFGDAWDAHYTGSNKAWGEVAEDWLNNVWMPNCNVRGPQYGFKRSMRLSGMAWDVDGDDLMVLTESRTGFPMLAFYPAPKIANWGDFLAPRNISNQLRSTSYASTVVDGGPYDGAKIFDGIIYDKNNRPVAIRVIDDEGNWQDISTFNADLAYEPSWSDQGRGIPRIAVSLLRWMDLQDIDDFLRRGMKRASSFGVLVKNEEGEGGIGNEIITSEEDTQLPPGESTDRRISYEEIEGGELYYLSAAGNESIEGVNYKNPHPNVEAYIERVTRGSLFSLGWFLELMDMSETGRAATRLMCDLANQSIWDRQETGYRRWKRAIGWAVGKGMKIGAIPQNTDGFDPYMWSPGLPKQLSVDAGNDFQADREGLKLGLTNKSIVMQKNLGLHYRAVDKQRAIELRETIEEAIAMSKEYPVLSFDRALELLEQRSPNPIAVRAQQGPDVKPKPGQPNSQTQSESVNLNLKLHQGKPPRRRVEVQRNEEGGITGYELVEVAEDQ